MRPRKRGFLISAAWSRLFNGGPCGAAARLAGAFVPVFSPPHGSAAHREKWVAEIYTATKELHTMTIQVQRRARPRVPIASVFP